MTVTLRNVLFALLIFCAMFPAAAQFKSASIGIDGLTCSSCSYGVEQSLKKLDFVDAIKTDLNSATAKVSFFPHKNVSVDDLAAKIVQAGFSVRFINVVYHFDLPCTLLNDTIHIGKEVYYFLQPPATALQGDVTLQLIGDKYVNRKTLKQWEPQMQLARIKYPLLRADTYFVLL